MKTESKSGRRLAASLILLWMMECQASRDPFRPVEVACQPEQVVPVSWQLKGIVGREKDYRVLLVTVKGKWAQRRDGEPVDERWYLLNVGPLGISLGDQKGCQPPVEKVLKGSLYEGNNLPAVDPLPVAFAG